MYNANAYSAASTTSPLAGTTIARRDLTEHDVQIEILFCGICHSDLHSVRNEWSSIMPTVYPIVPGHEIVGRVTKVGSAVTNYQPGGLAAVGCLIDSDGTCPQCKAGLEQFCPSLTLTFNSPDKHLGGVTYGGYSDSIVVDERFVLRVPSNLDLAGAAPLLCAGITTYSPMRHWAVTLVNIFRKAKEPKGCGRHLSSWKSSRVREHYQTTGGEIPGFGDILRYRFADTFDPSIFLDIDGNVIEEDGGRFLLPGGLAGAALRQVDKSARRPCQSPL
jgi:hypothetical protein